MSFIGNIIWLIFGGFFVFLEYIISGFILCCTIIGIPFGLQVMKIGVFALWPFGRRVVNNPSSTGCLSTLLNIIWIFIGGLWIALTHILWGLLFAITIIGIPFAKQHFKLAELAFMPFGKKIV